jgi:hypothetical protein
VSASPSAPETTPESTPETPWPAPREDGPGTP